MNRRRGQLRIYLGAAPGVGKTYKMLGEGTRRAARGTDVVIGVVETHGRPHTAEQLGQLETVPARSVEYRGATIREMDLDAVLARRPDVVLVDEYAHTNAPGSRHEKRWQDVELLLEAGIDVITTLNVQHLESLNDVIASITGITQRETVPDDVVRRADQLELVDMTPEAIRRRLAHGNIYPADRIDAAMANYFRAGNLGAMRELALLWVADRVEESLHDYLAAHGIDATWETRERVVVGLTGRTGGAMLIRRASRIAGRVSGELIAVHVAVDDGLAAEAGGELEAQRKLVIELGGSVHDVAGHDAAETLLAFARREKATQLVLGASRRSRWSELLRGSLVASVLRDAGTIDVHVIHDEQVEQRPAPTRPARQRDISRRRRTIAWLLVVLGLPVLIAVMIPVRQHTALSTVLLVVLTLVLVIAAIGGAGVGVVAAVVASLLVNWFFVPPYNTLTIAEFENVIALGVFVGVAVTVGSLVVTASRRALESQRARLEARALARAATYLATDPDPVPALMEEVRVTFGLRGVRLSNGDSAEALAEAGDTHGVASSRLALNATADAEQRSLGRPQLEVFGGDLTEFDHQLLLLLADQLSVALDKRLLAEEAAEADKLAEIDAVRTALLRAVSHDLRTPLASIKALASGLRDDEVAWQPDQIAEALATIEEETDRLNRLVSNLLDASRLQIGAVALDVEPTELAAVIDMVVAGVDADAGDIEVRPFSLDAAVLADAALLERSLDNVVRNALRFSPSGVAVTIDVGRVEDHYHIRVIDRGPGVDISERSRVTQPFQRLDDHSTDGVGLGLSIAQGFVEAMRGTLLFDDTPGGGLTVTISLRAA